MIRTYFLVLLYSCFLKGYSQNTTISGITKDKTAKAAVPFVSVILKTEKDSVFVTGTVSSEGGRFSIPAIKPGNYVLYFSFPGYSSKEQALFVGSLSNYL